MFAPEGDGIRVRLGSDAWRVGLAIASLGIVVFAYRGNAKIQQWLVHLTVPPPTGIA